MKHIEEFLPYKYDSLNQNYIATENQNQQSDFSQSSQDWFDPLGLRDLDLFESSSTEEPITFSGMFGSKDYIFHDTIQNQDNQTDLTSNKKNRT